MKQFKTIALSLAIILGFSAFNEAKAQFSGSEVTIYNTVSPYFEGVQVLADCNNPNSPTYKFKWGQAANSGFGYNGLSVPGYWGIPDEVVTYMLVVDAFGDQVIVGAPFTGYPQVATFPSGDTVEFNYYGCQHPTVVEIY